MTRFPPCHRFAVPLSFVLVAGCSQRIAWREVNVGEVPYQDAWSAVERITAVDGYRPDESGTDRGLRKFQTVWRARVGMGFGPGARSTRTRVRAEFDRSVEDASWIVRYCVERQRVGDIARSMEPRPEDWDDAGQDGTMEARLGARLRLHFGQSLTGTPDSDPRRDLER